MGSRSKTVQEQTETNIQDIDTTNINLEDIDGIGLADVSNVQISIQEVDAGAIAAAENISSGALNLAGDVTAQAIRSNESGLGRAFDFGEDIFGESVDVVSSAIRSNEATLSRSLKFGENIVTRTINTLSSAIGKAADATRSDAANTLGTLIKFGSVAVGVLGLGFIITRARG